MSNRRIEERAEFPNGIKTEWEPSRVKVIGSHPHTTREQVKELNRKAKQDGSYLRYRSVEVEES